MKKFILALVFGLVLAVAPVAFAGGDCDGGEGGEAGESAVEVTAFDYDAYVAALAAQAAAKEQQRLDDRNYVPEHTHPVPAHTHPAPVDDPAERG